MNAPDNRSLAITYADVAAAAERIAGHAHRTPVLTSRTVDERTGAKVFFKCENLQRIGAFKCRGAFNAVSQLSPAERARGVLSFSSGNHAQAVALAGRLLGVRVTIVMPSDAPAVKIEATRGYGAEIVLNDKRKETREEVAERVVRERGLTMIPPFDDPRIIAGQGTAAKELIEDAGALDVLLVPCGGGGLISGCAIAARQLSPKCRVIGVEPAAGDDATRSFREKRLITIQVPETIADGARTTSLGSITFPIQEMLTVTTELMRHVLPVEHESSSSRPALGAAGLFGGLSGSARRRDPLRRQRRSSC